MLTTGRAFDQHTLSFRSCGVSRTMVCRQLYCNNTSLHKGLATARLQRCPLSSVECSTPPLACHKQKRLYRRVRLNQLWLDPSRKSVWQGGGSHLQRKNHGRASHLKSIGNIAISQSTVYPNQYHPAFDIPMVTQSSLFTPDVNWGSSFL